MPDLTVLGEIPRQISLLDLMIRFQENVIAAWYTITKRIVFFGTGKGQSDLLRKRRSIVGETCHVIYRRKISHWRQRFEFIPFCREGFSWEEYEEK